MKNVFEYGMGVVALAVLVSPLYAATPAMPDPDDVVDPGAVERELQRQEQRIDEQLQQRDVGPVIEDMQAAPKVEQKGPTFKLLSVRFGESDYLSREQLTQLVKPYLGQQVDFVDLQQLVEDVNQFYHQLGVFTSRAVLPQQKIKNGVVFIRLIEGKLGKVEISGNQYIDAEFVQRWMSQKTTNGLINSRHLERDILLFNRSNDERLQAELRAGEKFGLTDIAIQVVEPDRNQAQIFIDNYGYESAGREEVGLLYRRQYLFVNADRTTIYALINDGTESLSLSYNAPLPKNGLRLGASASLTKTDVTSGDFAVIDVTGDSSRLGVDASWLAYSSTEFWLNALGNFNRSETETDVEGVALTSYKYDHSQLGAQFNWTVSRWQLSLRQMVSHVEGRDEILQESSQYTLGNGSFSAFSRLPNAELYAIGQVEWQHTEDTALPGSLAFSAGGPTSVRGYAPGFISGDSGYFFKVELHKDDWHIGKVRFDGYMFYDYGAVRSLNPRQSIVSTGLGVGVIAPYGLRLDFSAAQAHKQDIVPDQDSKMLYARLSWRFW
jgi:hemolysin activation/secretion protein